MLGRLTSLLGGDYNQKQLKKITPLVVKINEWNAKFETLTDEEIKNKTPEFKERYQNGETLDDLLPEAFAVVKQACKRLCGQTFKVNGHEQVWNMIPYDVQLIGGIILHQGKIAEMKTGEGKTLVAAAPVYLNALTWKGVHVVTVNDYLASRDAQWIGNLYQWLGLSIGNVVKGTPLSRRREEYSKDITYVENSELWFDYLRDNLVKNMESRSVIWRPLNFAIIDEIDSILIDEARTPLIISEGREEPTEKYVYYSNIIKALHPCSGKKKVSKGLLNELVNDDNKEQEEDGDYYIDEKTKTASLSGRWITKLEQILNVENLYKDLGFQEIHYIENALRAQAVYQRDVDYIVSGNEVLIVDEHTWRTMQGRRFSEGLHQAIEAKEGVPIQRESQTMATITYQNFFKQYQKLAGMTGTAATEGEEFNKIYDLEVVIVPTNKEVIRVDMNDKVYFDQATKWKFVKEYIKFYHEIGEPILIWTADIATSEFVSRILEKDAIPHYVLNAKFHEQEANIISNAGKYKSVVVATNMAWRWTDIKLEDGLNEQLAKNYAHWIQKFIEKKSKNLKVTVFSEKEFDLTFHEICELFGISDGEAENLKKGLSFTNDEVSLSLSFNRRKKSNSDFYASFSFVISWADSKEWEEKDFHYGLFILGTEKHESRRIDNQLRGRAGRQGDPGVSVFFVALDDLLMRKMGGERIKAFAGLLLSKEDLESLELTQKQFTNAITRAQKEIEAWHFGIRKHLFDYDSVINKQRLNIYHTRDALIEADLDPEKKKIWIEEHKRQFLMDAQNILDDQIVAAENTDQPLSDLLAVLNRELGLEITEEQKSEFAKQDLKTLHENLERRLVEYFQFAFEEIDDNILFAVFRDVNLHIIDKLWIDHIDEMQALKDKVGFMGYAQMDPLIMYKKESFDKFQDLLARIKCDTTTMLMRIDFRGISEQQKAQIQIMDAVKSDPELLQKLKQASGNIKAVQKSMPKQQPQDRRSVLFEDEDGVEVFEADDNNEIDDTSDVILPQNKKTRPNDLCPCGSGKKYKKCCWKDL